MLHRFVARTQKLAAKVLSNNAMRIYMNNTGALRASGFYANNRIKITEFKDRVEIALDPKGDSKVFDTGRGELIELKRKTTRDALGDIRHVTVTYRTGKIVIKAHLSERRVKERVTGLKTKLKDGLPFVYASLFSGLGMLSYHIKKGMSDRGIKSQIAFANDSDPLAMALNVDHNPIWDDATDDAQAISDLIQSLLMMDLPQVDWVDVSYPCVGFSLLADPSKRDINHPECGTLFVSLIAVLKRMNPSVMVFENVPAFAQSETYKIIKRELPDYTFKERIMSGHVFGEMEDRKRVAIIATSDGLPEFDMSSIVPLPHQPRILSDILSVVPDDSPMYREMAHVKRRDEMHHIGYRNCLYQPDAKTITTVTASYSSPKAGSPMIAHPTDPSLQRQITVEEHGTLRYLPDALHHAVCAVADGRHSMVSSRGSKEAGHRLCGNGVSRWIWESVGSAMADFFHAIRTSGIDRRDSFAFGS